MPDATPSPDTDDKPIYDALRAAKVPEDVAYTAVQRIRDVAAANLIAQVMAKLDAQNAQLDAMRGELSVQRWLMGLGFAALVAAAIAQLFRG